MIAMRMNEQVTDVSSTIRIALEEQISKSRGDVRTIELVGCECRGERRYDFARAASRHRRGADHRAGGSAALLGGNAAEVHEWVADVLGPLATDSPNDARLRETLRVFLRTGSSSKAAARELDLHFNPMKYRVGRAVARRGADRRDRIDVELALSRLVLVRGRGAQAAHGLSRFVVRDPPRGVRRFATVWCRSLIPTVDASSSRPQIQGLSPCTFPNCQIFAVDRIPTRPVLPMMTPI